MPIRRKPKGKRKPGQYTTMPVKPKRGLKPKGPQSARKPKGKPRRKGRFTTLPIKKKVSFK